MFSCYASEKKPKTPIVHDLEDNKNKSNINNEDLSNIHMDNLKKMDENALTGESYPVTKETFIHNISISYLHNFFKYYPQIF